MTIKELKETLNEYKNQDAKVLITIGNEDNDILSTSEFELFSDTSEDLNYVEIFIHEDCRKQI